MAKLSNTIRRLRSKLGFTQVQLAETLGVTVVTISRWENGHVRPNRFLLRALVSLAQDASKPEGPVLTKYLLKDKKIGSRESSETEHPFIATFGAQKKGKTELDASSFLNQWTKFLEKPKTFSSLNIKKLSKLLSAATERKIEAGQFVFREGDLLKCSYIICTGLIKVLKHSPSGKDFIIDFSGPGEMLGNIAIFPDETHPDSAQAVLDTELLEVKNDGYLKFLYDHPDLAFIILRNTAIFTSMRLADIVMRITDLAAERANYRVAYILSRLSFKFGLVLPFAREEIAQMSGTTTETAVRILNEFKKIGIVKLTRRRIIIVNQPKLRELLESLRNI